MIGWSEFAKVARKTVSERELSPEELRLLYRIFDSDRDGFLELGELHRLEASQKDKAKYKEHHGS